MVLFQAINNFLKEPSKNHDLKVQVCRANGNLFYENGNDVHLNW